MGTFKGKSVVVTGGSRGIGKAIALGFFQEGASVFICARDTKEVSAACSGADPKKKRFVGIAADVSKEKDCRKVIAAAVKKFGRIDILVNAAGTVGVVGELEKNDPTKWLGTVKTNLFGTAMMSKYALASMKKAGKGKIINFAGGGVGSKKPMPNFSAYYSSKLAIVGLTETVAAEVEKDNIQVNAIAPGAINTAMTDYTLAQGPEKTGEDIYKRVLEQKKGKGDSLEAVVNLALFLGSEESAHISGRLLSAKWDKIDMLKGMRKEDSDLFKVRRIDNELFSIK